MGRLSRSSGFPRRAFACLAFLLGAIPSPAADKSAVAMGESRAANPAWPAARRHVRILDGEPYKFTSRLRQVAELNFTMGESHQTGKKVISDALTRIGIAYGFQVKKIASGSDGSHIGVIPAFTLDDLLSGEVMVANNIGGFGNSTFGAARQSAIQAAIETHGRGYLAFHGSGDNQATGWPWYTTTLHPLRYQGRGYRTSAPVYKHLAESSHVVLEGILDSGTTLAGVPDELDASGNEVLAHDVPTRRMKSEWFRWGRDISRDSAYRDKVTVLLKYDPRALGADELGSEYKRKGGGLFTYLYKVGAGMTSYVLPGHENDELLDRTTGFDGGVGDFDRYVAQTLFFLAGYHQESCDSACLGLPLADSHFHRTGATFTGTVTARGGLLPRSTPIVFEPLRPGFHALLPGPVSAELATPAGQVVERTAGQGPFRHAFAGKSLPPGIYLLRVRMGARPPRTRLYAVGG